MTRIRFAPFLLLVGGVACSAVVAPVAPTAPTPPDAERVLYYPVQVGTKWVYDERDREGYAQIITASEKKNGQYLVTVKSTSTDWKDDETTTLSQYAVSSEGVFSIASRLEDGDRKVVFEKPYCLLKLPNKVGEKWGEGKEQRVAGKVEPITVPAGTFDAIRVDMGENHTFWYAAGAGVVKARLNDIHREMKSFTLPDG